MDKRIKPMPGQWVSVENLNDFVIKTVPCKQTAKDILKAIFNPKVNFIEYIEEIINE